MNKLNLNNVTILCIDGVNPDIGLKALKYSIKDINFANAKLLSHIKPNNIPINIEFVEIQKLSHESYNSFMLHELYKYVDTDFCLIIHDDGFVINPHLWDDRFLNYDYIGAPWKNYGQINRVGNGGFSLRSKKLINLCKHMISSGHEDGTICLTYKQELENSGCNFAPIEIAMKFSLESRIDESEFNLNNTFGFHGRGDPKNICDHDGFYQQFQDRLRLLVNII
jgi:hypothetical protein